MTQSTPTIAQLRREARALVNDANMPVGLGAVLKLYALKLDAIADGERHKSNPRCNHLYESHGKHGCTLCSTCQFVPIRELARVFVAPEQCPYDQATLRCTAAGGPYRCWCAETRQNAALTQPQGHSPRPAPTPVVEYELLGVPITKVDLTHDCVTDHDWPDNPVPFEATTCRCGHMWTYLGNGLWTDDEQEVSTRR